MDALVIDSISKQYYTGSALAVSDLSISIKPGTVYGILGPNGAGKTTAMKMIVGLLQPDKGSVKIFGEPAGTIAANKRLGYLPENPVFYRYLKGIEFLVMHGVLMGLSKQQAQHDATELLDSVRLKESKFRPIREYSKGMNQRLGLAQALIGDPDLLLLDEPLDGLDAFGRPEIKKILLDLKKKRKTILFNSHILSDVEEICDDIGIIDRGKLVKQGSIKSLLPARQSLETYFVNVITKSREKKS